MCTVLPCQTVQANSILKNSGNLYCRGMFQYGRYVKVVGFVIYGW